MRVTPLFYQNKIQPQKGHTVWNHRPHHELSESPTCLCRGRIWLIDSTANFWISGVTLKENGSHTKQSFESKTLSVHLCHGCPTSALRAMCGPWALTWPLSHPLSAPSITLAATVRAAGVSRLPLPTLTAASCLCLIGTGTGQQHRKIRVSPWSDPGLGRGRNQHCTRVHDSKQSGSTWCNPCRMYASLVCPLRA